MPVLVAQRFTSLCIPELHAELVWAEGFLNNSGEKRALYICLLVAHGPVLLPGA